MSQLYAIALGLAELQSTTTLLHNREDPLLTKVIVSLFSPPSVLLMFQRTFFTICFKALMTTGMRGSGGPRMMVLGKKLYTAARSH